MTSLFDRIPKNSDLDSNRRRIQWVENKLQVIITSTKKPLKAVKKAPPWNFRYLRADLLERLGWKWAPKPSPPVVASQPSIPKKTTVVEVVPLRHEPLQTRVQVFWGHYKRFYTGTLINVDSSRVKSHRVEYDDGDIVWEFDKDCEALLPEFDDESFSGCAFCFKKCKLSKCSKCKTVSYCSVNCQSKDWTLHKTNCQKD